MVTRVFATCTSYKGAMSDQKLIEDLKKAADRWETEHPIIGVGALRYCDALRAAAYRLEDLDEQFEALRRTAEDDKLHDAYIETLGERDGLEAKVIILEKRLSEYDKAREEGRLVVKPKCSECRYEKDVIGRCFHCLGSQRLEPDRSEAALGGGEN